MNPPICLGIFIPTVSGSIWIWTDGSLDSVFIAFPVKKPLPETCVAGCNPLLSVCDFFRDAHLWRAALGGFSGPKLTPLCGVCVSFPISLSWKYGRCQSTPVTKVNASVTPAAPRDGRQTCAAVHTFLRSQRDGEDPPRAERLSLLAGLFPTQWFTLWFRGVFSHTDTCLCDTGRTA